MNNPENGEQRKTRFWQKPRSKWMLGIPIGGFIAFVAGAIGISAFNYTLHATSSTEFCFECHSHELNIRPEYEASNHAKNASGVRAECADCHLPKPWHRYVWTKMVVSLDIIPELQGAISTPEKYAERRGYLKKKVWIEYKENGSEFCMHCHQWEYMDSEEQGRMASRMHTRAQEKGQTCIDCHRGLVHDMNDSHKEIWQEVDAMFEEEEASAETAAVTSN